VLHGNGWVHMGNPPYGADGLHVRVRRDPESGRWVVTDVYLHGKELTAESMRRGISVPRIEAYLNRPGGADPGSADDDGLEVAEMRRRAHLLAEKRREERAAGVSRGALVRPDRTDPESFYALVASAYGQYAAESKAPAKAIADEAGVPVSTAHRWVREARRRGFLPPGQKGKAG
jgi:hypothetical protein